MQKIFTPANLRHKSPHQLPRQGAVSAELHNRRAPRHSAHAPRPSRHQWRR